MDSPWRITLFGELGAELASSSQTPSLLLTRFRTRKTALLLGYLALTAPEGRAHAREALAELLWPDTDPLAARNRLKQEIAALRRQLEPPGVPTGAVLVADRFSLQLNPSAIVTDVRTFEDLLTRANRTEAPNERMRLREQARTLYQGDLLSAFYEDWVLQARERLREQFRDALLALASDYESQGALDTALSPIRQALLLAPLDEEAQTRLIRLLFITGKTAEARRQHATWAQLCEKEFGSLPVDTFASLTGHLRQRDSSSDTHGTPVPSPSLPAARIRPLDLPTAVRLPLQFTRFFGRREEIDRIVAALSGTVGRLVTLTGPGGAGKTRLAIEAARSSARFFAGGVFFVSLAGIAASVDVPEAILRALDVEMNSSTDALQQATHVLAERDPCLLVLDNLEHLIQRNHGGVSILSVLQPLRAGATKLTLLVTSRIRLDLTGEAEFAVPPLPVPQRQASPEELIECESIQLFLDRARLANQDFQLTSRNAESIATLCRLLDGIPLALELAAGWARTLTPSQIVATLSRSLDLLVSRRQDVPERHRSLAATIAWSYDLLAPDDQRTFAELSAFAGEFDLTDADHICTALPALPRIENLCRCSLLQTCPAAGSDQTPYRLLEPLREYARERLQETPEAFRTIESRHCDYFARFARTQRERFYRSEEAEALSCLERRSDNLREARDAAARANDLPAIVDLSLALGGLAQRRGYILIAVGHVQFGLDAIVPFRQHYPLLYALLLRERAGLYLDQEQPMQAEECIWQTLELLKTAKDAAEIPATLNVLAQARLAQRDYAGARSLIDDALRQAEAHHQTFLVGILHNNRGLVEQRDPSGSVEAAAFHLQEALRRHRDEGNLRGAASSLNNLAILFHTANDLTTAERHYLDALRCERQIGHRFGIGRALNNLGEIAEAQGERERSLRLYAAAERIFAELQSPYREYTRGLLEAAAQNALSPIHLTDLRRDAAIRTMDSLIAWSFGDESTSASSLFLP